MTCRAPWRSTSTNGWSPSARRRRSPRFRLFCTGLANCGEPFRRRVRRSSAGASIGDGKSHRSLPRVVGCRARRGLGGKDERNELQGAVDDQGRDEQPDEQVELFPAVCHSFIVAEDPFLCLIPPLWQRIFPLPRATLAMICRSRVGPRSAEDESSATEAEEKILCHPIAPSLRRLAVRRGRARPSPSSACRRG